MKKFLFIIAATLTALGGFAQDRVTLDEFKANLLSADIVEFVGKVVDEEAPQLFSGPDGDVSLTVANLVVIKTNNKQGHHQQTKMQIHIYDKDSPTEHVVQSGNVSNWVYEPTPEELLMNGEDALALMRDVGITIPATPVVVPLPTGVTLPDGSTEINLRMRCSVPDWIGRKIKKFGVRDKNAQQGNVSGVLVRADLYELDEAGNHLASTERVEAFVWVANGEYRVSRRMD